MTETACPTCGAKCVSNPKYRDDYSALPPPDLTKLREAFKDYIYTATRPEMLHMEPYVDRIIKAVKELLEGNK